MSIISADINHNYIDAAAVAVETAVAAAMCNLFSSNNNSNKRRRKKKQLQQFLVPTSIQKEIIDF